jgi:hypothetical protein
MLARKDQNLAQLEFAFCGIVSTPQNLFPALWNRASAETGFAPAETGRLQAIAAPIVSD